VCVAGREVEPQTPAADSSERMNQHTRKQLLETLLDIIEKKKNTKNDSEATELKATNDSLPVSSSEKQQIQNTSSVNTLPSSSSAAYRRHHKSREFHNSPHLTESADTSGRSISPSMSVSKQCEQLSVDAVDSRGPSRPDKKPLLQHCSSSSKDDNPQQNKRKLPPGKISLSWRSQSRAAGSSGVHVVEAAVDVASSRSTSHANVMTGCESDRCIDRLSGKPDDQPLVVSSVQVLPQEHNNRVILLHTAVNKPLPVRASEPQHIGDKNSALASSPPRKVRLKFRDVGSGASDNQTALPVTETGFQAVKPCQNTNFPHNSKQRQQHTEDAVTYCNPIQPDKKLPLLGHSPSSSNHLIPPLVSQSTSRHFSSYDERLMGTFDSLAREREDVVKSKPEKKPPLLGRSPTTSKRLSMPPVSRGSKRTFSGHDKSLLWTFGRSNRDREDAAENCSRTKPGKKSPLFGRSPTTSKRLLSPPVSRGSKRTSSGHDKSLVGTIENSASERVRGVSECSKKPLLRVSPKTEGYIKSERDIQHHSRVHLSGQRATQGGKFVERAVNDQHSPRKDRFKSEPLWQQRSEDVSLQRIDSDVTWLEENRRDRSQEERAPVLDLREKLNSRRRCENWPRRDEDESFHRDTCTPVVFDREPASHTDDGRRGLPRAPPPPYQPDNDVRDEFDDLLCDFKRRRHHSSLLGEFPGYRRGNMLPQDDEECWVPPDRRHRRQLYEYGDPSLHEEPRHDWRTEVRQLLFDWMLLKHIG